MNGTCRLAITRERQTGRSLAPIRKKNMRVVIIEDDSLFRENLRMLLAGDPGLTVVDAFATAEEALAMMHSLKPDVALVDLGLPGMTGVELIRRIREEHPDTEVLAHTVFDERETVFSAIKAGASGYILKGASPWELIEALHNLYAGGAPMSQKIARKVIQELQHNGINEQYLLTQREKDIVKGIENGLSYKEIAATLTISPHTVHTHIKHIYDKLQAKDRQDVLLKARRKGII